MILVIFLNLIDFIDCQSKINKKLHPRFSYFPFGGGIRG